MRQVHWLLDAIGNAELVEFYTQILSYGTVHGVKLPSLTEFLNLTSNKGANDQTSFDEKTDTLLEQQALKRLAERQKLHG